MIAAIAGLGVTGVSSAAFVGYVATVTQVTSGGILLGPFQRSDRHPAQLLQLRYLRWFDGSCARRLLAQGQRLAELGHSRPGFRHLEPVADRICHGQPPLRLVPHHRQPGRWHQHQQRWPVVAGCWRRLGSSDPRPGRHHRLVQLEPPESPGSRRSERQHRDWRSHRTVRPLGERRRWAVRNKRSKRSSSRPRFTPRPGHLWRSARFVGSSRASRLR